MIIWIIGLMVASFVGIFSAPIAIIIGVVSFILPFFPLEGFNDLECVTTIYLIPLRNWKGEVTKEYIRRCDNKITFAHDVREVYGIEEEAYEVDSVKGDVKVYKSNECEKPYLKIYKKTPVRTGIAVAPFSTKIQYVFCIPEKDKKDNPECNFKGEHTRIERLS